MTTKTTTELVAEAATIVGYVGYAGLSFRAIKGVDAKGRLVTSHINPSGMGYMMIRPAGVAGLRKVCLEIIANKEALLAKQASERAAFAAR